jgi:hypothetical protein
MKLNKVSCLVISFVFMITGACLAVDYVDIGDLTSEAGHNLISWGPVEPAASGGAFGGIDDCRVIWHPQDASPNGPGSVDAYVDLAFSGGSEILTIKHLDGIGDDSFEVWVNDPSTGWTLYFTYANAGSTETWYTTAIPISLPAGVHQVRFEAIGDLPNGWSGWNTYGQLAISDLWVTSTVSVDEGAWGSVKSLFR